MSERALNVVPSGGADRPATAGVVLGKDLLQLRKDRGLLQKEVVDAGGFSSVSMLSKYERAKVTFQEEHVVALARFYGVRDPEVLDSMRLLVRKAGSKQWWDSFRDVVPGWLGRLFGMQEAAREIRTFEALLVPGLLQTPDYARAVMRAPFWKSATAGVGVVDAKEIERRLEARLKRQQLLEQMNAPDFYALLDENILNRPTGGASVMRGQLRHLYNLAENKDRVHIRILPFAAATEAPAPTPSITLLKFPPEQGDDVVYVEATNRGGTYVSDTADVENHRLALDHLWTLAAKKEASLALLQRYIDQLSGKR